MAFMSLNGIDVSYDKKKQILKGLNLEVALFCIDVVIYA